MAIELLIDRGASLTGLSESQRAMLRELRREINSAAHRGPFDPRHVLLMAPRALATWQAARAEWIVSKFAGDPRVEGLRA